MQSIITGLAFSLALWVMSMVAVWAVLRFVFGLPVELWR
ncbi:hypothetical protein PTXU04_00072 [Escherichia phage PTXU04]|uniref:Uncharacterized protein n=1 Tax=Escherichia phage PTXU04 TaxID=2508206 RepID=A0A482MSY2_9CAUD|nr:hypothetical protein HOV50_gp72 [Escherichia phage PTXU04]QBQ76686.1 hypothetical protein PTXU04_00072 [Escherichia phage PTXU04]